MAATIYIPVTNVGGNIVIDGSTFPSTEVTIEFLAQANVVLSNNFHMEIFPEPVDGTVINYLVGLNNLDLNGHTFDIDSVFFSQTLIDVLVPFFGNKYYLTGGGGTIWHGEQLFYGIVNGSLLLDGTVTFDKLETLNRGNIIVGNSSNIASAIDAKGSGKILIGDGTDLNSVSQSGDVIFSTAGVSAIQAGVIVNADVNASAAITRSKLASGTADYVVKNSNTGVLSEEAQLAAVRGGLGIDTSASTGFAKCAAGTWSVSTLTDITRRENISFVTANQGTYYVYFPFACTVTNINVRVTSIIAGTDAGSLTIQNDAGSAMVGSSLTAGALAVASGAAFGTGYSSTLTSNNTFTAGQSMKIISSKTTSGGVVSADITYTRTS